MTKTCLLIDDNRQDEVVEQIVVMAKKKGITLKCLQFNVGSEQRTDLLTDGFIDKAKVLSRFKDEFDGSKIDLICIDYSLEDDNINGLDILKEIYELRQSSAFMIYSSNLDQLAKGIIDGYENDKDKLKLINRIKSLTKYTIKEFVARDRYDQAIVDILSKGTQSIELTIEEKLLENPDMIFKNTYPVFEDKTFKEIAKEIRLGSFHGDNFKKEIIEQTIAYLTKINLNE